MVSLTTPLCNFGWPAPAFTLPGTDGGQHSLASCRGPNGLLVMFICNHCPYVKAILERLLCDARELSAAGIGCVAISANDPSDYPEDSFEHMQQLASTHHFPFPYLYDPTQSVARDYDAVCTPDFYGFNKDLELQYRGRLDSSRIEPAGPDAKRELIDAMRQISRTGKGPAEQIASIGCSIKWRTQ